MLFSNIINQICKNDHVKKIYIIDYKDGALNKLTKDSEKLQRIYFYDKKKIEVPKNSVLILQSLVPYTLRDELIISNEIKIFFWNLHPENLIPNFIPVRFLNNLIKSNYKFFKNIIDFFFVKRLNLLRDFLELCVAKDGLIFMDSSNLHNTCYKLNFKKPERVTFLPVPVSKSLESEREIKTNFKNKILSVSWVGRVEGFKYSILFFLLNEISAFCIKSNVKICFNLIGDGEQLKQIKNLKFNSNLMEIKFHRNLNYEDLIDFLNKNVDLAFAMGTSALDSSKIGIPTVLLDYSFKKIKNYSFRWIFDTQDFDLAHEIENNEYSGPTYSISKIIHQYYNYKDELSLKSKNYVLKNHNVENVSNFFLNLVNKTELEFGMINKSLLNKGFLRKYYYMSNNYYTGTK